MCGSYDVSIPHVLAVRQQRPQFPNMQRRLQRRRREQHHDFRCPTHRRKQHSHHQPQQPVQKKRQHDQSFSIRSTHASRFQPRRCRLCLRRHRSCLRQIPWTQTRSVVRFKTNIELIKRWLVNVLVFLFWLMKVFLGRKKNTSCSCWDCNRLVEVIGEEFLEALLKLVHQLRWQVMLRSISSAVIIRIAAAGDLVSLISPPIQ